MKGFKNVENNNNVLCVIFDSVSEQFTAPTSFVNEKVAVRSFIDLLNSDIYKNHKSDYSLYQIGFYDFKTGKIELFNDFKRLIAGSSLKE